MQVSVVLDHFPATEIPFSSGVISKPWIRLWVSDDPDEHDRIIPQVAECKVLVRWRSSKLLQLMKELENITNSYQKLELVGITSDESQANIFLKPTGGPESPHYVYIDHRLYWNGDALIDRILKFNNLAQVTDFLYWISARVVKVHGLTTVPDSPSHKLRKIEGLPNKWFNN